jgi:hypothetical protein
MEPMSFWRLLENSPEWVSAIATVLFGVATLIVIISQVRVMKAQTRVLRYA